MKLLTILPTVWLALSFANAGEIEKWEVPIGGNAYLTSSAANSKGRVDAGGLRGWQGKDSVFSIWFHTDRAGVVELSLRLKVPTGESTMSW